MQNFEYQNASKIIFGSHDEGVLAREIKSLGAKKVLLHYGQNSVIKSGLLAKIQNALRAEKIDFIEYGGVRANPLRSHTLAGVDLAKARKVDFVLAVGGGSVIDSAKCIAAGALTPNIWDYYDEARSKVLVNKRGENKPLPAALPLGVVLTIPAAGSEGSLASVIRDDRTGLKYALSDNLLRSRFAFVNPAYCATLPKCQVAYGASDILAHMLERYFSPEPHVVVTDKILGGAIQSMFEIAPKVFKNPGDFQAMSEFCLLGTLAHNGMLALGRAPQAWECHPIENAVISGHFNFAHGQGLAILFPAWLKYLGKREPKILQFAREVMNAAGKTDDEVIKNAIAALEKFYLSLDLPTRLGDLGIDAAAAKGVARTAFPPDVRLGGFGRLTLADIQNILDLAR